MLLARGYTQEAAESQSDIPASSREGIIARAFAGGVIELEPKVRACATTRLHSGKE